MLGQDLTSDVQLFGECITALHKMVFHFALCVFRLEYIYLRPSGLSSVFIRCVSFEFKGISDDCFPVVTDCNALYSRP